jgi:hypothetical protein
VTHTRAITAILLALAALTPSASAAQEAANTSPEEFLSLLGALEGALQTPRLVVLQGVATATTFESGTAFASISGTTKREGGTGIDGSFAFGVGFGDAKTALGGQIVANITSSNPSDFGDSGSLSLKVSRMLPEQFGSASIGATFDNLAPWGDVVGQDVKTSLALTFARNIPLAGSGQAMPILLNFGAASETSYRNDWTAFAAIGLGLSENLSITLAHNGDYEILGLATRLPAVDNLSLSVSLLDALDRKDDRRLSISASYAFNDLF